MADNRITRSLAGGPPLGLDKKDKSIRPIVRDLLLQQQESEGQVSGVLAERAAARSTLGEMRDAKKRKKKKKGTYGRQE